RAADTVARLGGDEFAILLPQITDVREAMDVCERIRASLAAPVVIGSDTLFVEASVGIALSPDHGNDVDTLMRHADVAMYVAKRADTDCALYDPGADRYSPTVNELASGPPHPIERAELPAVIDNLLRTWNVPPSALRIEVTETSAMADVERTLATLTQLHEMGVAISIDDFGTGYSSLAYLHRMPVDQLKIDRSFILDLEENANSQAIVGSTIVLAHSLGLKAVAEGVE